MSSVSQPAKQKCSTIGSLMQAGRCTLFRQLYPGRIVIHCTGNWGHCTGSWTAFFGIVWPRLLWQLLIAWGGNICQVQTLCTRLWAPLIAWGDTQCPVQVFLHFHTRISVMWVFKQYKIRKNIHYGMQTLLIAWREIHRYVKFKLCIPLVSSTPDCLGDMSCPSSSLFTVDKRQQSNLSISRYISLKTKVTSNAWSLYQGDFYS